MSNLRDAKPRVKTITLNDGVERELRFTLNAMAEMEDKYGSVDAAFKKLDEGSIKAARFIMWAGLLHYEDPSLTEQPVGNLIDLQSMQQIMQSMSEAMSEDMPQPDSNGDTNIPNA
jgi:hypothetical protein